MSEATKKPNRKKSFADKITAVKESAPLAEKKKSAPKEKKSIGQPKKEEKIKQNIPIVIYVNEQQKEQVEQNSINAGYSAKDRAKWLKSIAIREEAEVTEDMKTLEKIDKIISSAIEAHDFFTEKEIAKFTNEQKIRYIDKLITTIKDIKNTMNKETP